MYCYKYTCAAYDCAPGTHLMNTNSTSVQIMYYTWLDSLSLSFREVQHFIGVIHGHRGRLLLHLSLPRVQSVLQQLHLQGATVTEGITARDGAGQLGSEHVCVAHRVSYGPVGEACGVTQVPQVIDVTEELVVQLREAEHRNGAVLIESASVALQTRTEVC